MSALDAVRGIEEKKREEPPSLAADAARSGWPQVARPAQRAHPALPKANPDQARRVVRKDEAKVG